MWRWLPRATLTYDALLLRAAFQFVLYPWRNCGQANVELFHADAGDDVSRSPGVPRMMMGLQQRSGDNLHPTPAAGGLLVFGLLLGGCIYLQEPDPFEGMNPGDVTGVAVGRLAGLQSDSAVPLQGVRAQLVGSMQRSVTAANGRFVLRNLPQGNHQLLLTVGPAEQPLSMLRHPVNMPARSGVRATVDLGRLELVEPAALSGRVTLQGAGALADVRVTARDVTSPDAVVDGRSAVGVDDAGAFVLRGLGPGTWQVLASLGSRTALSTARVLAAGAQDDVGTLTLDVQAPATPATVQARLHAAPNVSGPVPLTVRLTPTPAALDLQPCANQVDLVPQQGAASVVVPGCVAGGPYRLEVLSDGTFLPWVRDEVLLAPGNNDLGDLFLTLPQDCPACEVVDVPDAGAASSSGGAGSSSTVASSSLASSSTVSGSSGPTSGPSSQGTSSSVGSTSSSSGGMVEMGTLVPTVPGLTAFNSWVDNTPLAQVPELDVPCPLAGTTNLINCQHVGVFRQMPVIAVMDCASIMSVTDTDGMGGPSVMEWRCLDNPVRVVSTGFVEGRGLTDLLDWTPSPPVFRPFRVEVRTAAGLVAQSLLVPPWTDVVIENPPSVTTAMTEPALVVALRGTRTADLEIQRGLVAVTTLPMVGAVDLASFAVRVLNTASRVWLEGGYTGDSDLPRLRLGEGVAPLEAVWLNLVRSRTALLAQNVRGLQGRDLQFLGLGQTHALMDLDTTDGLDLRQLVVRDGNAVGVQVRVSQRVLLDKVQAANVGTGIEVSNVGRNPSGTVALNNVRIQDVVFAGIDVGPNSHDVRMSDIRVANSSGVGLRIQNCERCVVLGGSFQNNGDVGVVLANVSGGVFRNLVTGSNATNGLSVSVAVNVLLGEITAVNNGSINVYLQDVANSVVSRVLSVGASQYGVEFFQTQADPNTAVYDLASSNNGAEALAVLSASNGPTFHGVLKLGPFAATECLVSPVYADLTASCLPAGASTFVPTSSLDLNPDVAGLVPGRTALAADLVAAHQWLTETSPTAIWADVTPGRCTGTCELREYGLSTLAPETLGVAWADPNVAPLHVFSGVLTAPECASLGGTFSSRCERQHLLAFAPLPGAVAAVHTGLCVPQASCGVEQTCNCTPVQNVGAYQGNTPLGAAMTEAHGGGELQVHRYISNGL